MSNDQTNHIIEVFEVERASNEIVIQPIKDGRVSNYDEMDSGCWRISVIDLDDTVQIVCDGSDPDEFAEVFAELAEKRPDLPVSYHEVRGTEATKFGPTSWSDLSDRLMEVACDDIDAAEAEFDDEGDDDEMGAPTDDHPLEEIRTVLNDADFARTDVTQAKVAAAIADVSRFRTEIVIHPLYRDPNGLMVPGFRHFMEPGCWRLSVWSTGEGTQKIHQSTINDPIGQPLLALLEAYPDLPLHYSELDNNKDSRRADTWEGMKESLDGLAQYDLETADEDSQNDNALDELRKALDTAITRRDLKPTPPSL